MVWNPLSQTWVKARYCNRAQNSQNSLRDPLPKRLNSKDNGARLSWWNGAPTAIFLCGSVRRPSIYSALTACRLLVFFFSIWILACAVPLSWSMCHYDFKIMGRALWHCSLVIWLSNCLQIAAVSEMFWQREICVVNIALPTVERGNWNCASAGFRCWWLAWSPQNKWLQLILFSFMPHSSLMKCPIKSIPHALKKKKKGLGRILGRSSDRSNSSLRKK